ncbi:hypothetical protein B0J17DRAFT_705987 [Rhizoctonia solani]|nr:hypothetical protein B0J17DRAFT_705987 [Rhizoctonia solani]
MKYASVIIPLVLVGVLFLLGCIWVATRKDKDDGDEESVPELASPTPKKPFLGVPKPDLAMPVLTTRRRMQITRASVLNSGGRTAVTGYCHSGPGFFESGLCHRYE